MGLGESGQKREKNWNGSRTIIRRLKSENETRVLFIKKQRGRFLGKISLSFFPTALPAGQPLTSTRKVLVELTRDYLVP